MLQTAAERGLAASVHLDPRFAFPTLSTLEAMVLSQCWGYCLMVSPALTRS